MSKALVDLVPESDRFEDAPHPRETTGLVGHGPAEAQLLDAYRSGRLPQAVLIGGPAGVGKATLAWRLARFIAAHPDRTASAVQDAADLFVAPDDPTARRINAGAQGDLFVLRREWNEKTKRLYSEIRADDVRRAIVMFQRSAGRGGYRICILDCAEDLNRSGANALLKLIEEPPPHSLFLIVAHRPAQVLPTIRSRCRKLMLKPLSTAETLAVVEEVGAPWASRPMAERQAAAARAEGSAQAALRLLGGGGLELDAQMRRLLHGLPAVDWRTVHALADKVAARDDDTNYDAMLGATFAWLDAAVHAGAVEGAAPDRLAPYAEVWEKITQAARECEALNLDRRQFVLTMFAELSVASSAPPS